MRKTKKNYPPGSLVYTGTYTEEPLVLELYVYDEQKIKKHILKNLQEVDQYKGIKWLNFTGLSQVEAIAEAANHFDIDLMVMEDILHVAQRSKIEILDESVFSIFKMVYMSPQNHVKHEHVSFILKDNLLITFQETIGDVFDGVRNSIENDKGQIRKQGAPYLFYALTDAIVDHHLEVMDYIQESIDDIEKSIFDGDDKRLDELYFLRKELMLLKTAVFPLEESLFLLMSDSNTTFDPAMMRYFKDIQDHIIHVKELLILYREVIASLFETHQSNVNNHMNSVMTTLTFFSAIFIPLSFLAGVFGMNFRNFPSLNAPNGIYIFTGFCVLVIVSMVVFFKKKQWF